MQHVLIVCGAGASSQFIVQRIRRIQRDGGAAPLPFSLRAAALDLLPETAPDLVYLGPHLEAAADQVREQYPEARIAVMTAEEYADHSGELPQRRLMLELMPPPAGTPHRDRHSSAAADDAEFDRRRQSTHQTDGSTHHG